MKSVFLEELARRVLVCDGAMGTLLYDRGVSFDVSFDSVCLTSPELVRSVHREYIKAGADIIETNSFGANTIRLEAHGLSDQTKLINRTAASLARHAREEMGRDVFVAGSIGPTGKTLYPLGPVTREQAHEAYSRQVEGLLEGGVDLFMVETFSDLIEIELAIDAIRRQSELPIVAQMTFTSAFTTILGTTPEHCLDFLSQKPVDVIGANCSVGPQMMVPVMERLAAHARLPLSALPNASLPKYVEGRYIYVTSPDYFAQAAQEFLNLGVRLIGGCCGTTPEYIRRLVELVNQTAVPKKEIRGGLTFVEEMPPKVERRAEYEQSSFAKSLGNKFVVSVELDPPRGSNPEKILKAADLMAELGVDAINVADSPMARVRMGALACAGLIVQRTGMEVILHMTGRDRNLMGLQSDLLGAHALGIKNILAVTGDPPASGDYPNITAVYDVDSIGLLKIIDSLNRAEDTAGNSIGFPTALTPGVAVNPVSENYKREVERWHIKEEMGAVFAMTQPLFDVEPLLRFLDDVKGTKVKILAGLLPVISFRHATFLHNEVPGIHVPQRIRDTMEKAGENGIKASVDITTELIEKVRPYVAGIYFMPSFGRFTMIAEIIRLSELTTVKL